MNTDSIYTDDKLTQWRTRTISTVKELLASEFDECIYRIVEDTSEPKQWLVNVEHLRTKSVVLTCKVGFVFPAGLHIHGMEEDWYSQIDSDIPGYMRHAVNAFLNMAMMHACEHADDVFAGNPTQYLDNFPLHHGHVWAWVQPGVERGVNTLNLTGTNQGIQVIQYNLDLGFRFKLMDYWKIFTQSRKDLYAIHL